MRLGDYIFPRSANRRRATAVLGALLALAAVSLGAPESEPTRVTAVRFWSLGDLTRVTIEVDSDFTLKSVRLPDPDRLFFSIRDARPQLSPRIIAVGDGLIKQIRVAETQPGITRVVLDLD